MNLDTKFSACDVDSKEVAAQKKHNGSHLAQLVHALTQPAYHGLHLATLFLPKAWAFGYSGVRA